MSTTAAIILAAGNSSRLGTAKQLLPYRGIPLVQHVAATVIDAGCDPVILVTGASSEAVSEALASFNVITVYNPDWQTGMASSIRTGVQYLQKHCPGAGNILLTVCDQPFLSGNHIRLMLRQKTETGKTIIGSRYAGIIGSPVLFDRQYLPDLETLQGEEGARKILKRYPNDVSSVPFEKGEIDVDTKEDYQSLTGLSDWLPGKPPAQNDTSPAAGDA